MVMTPVAGLTDLAAVRPKVLEYARARPEEPLILGVGAFYELFADNAIASRKLLDDIIAERPFALLAADLHTVWANTLTLDQAGLCTGRKCPRAAR